MKEKPIIYIFAGSVGREGKTILSQKINDLICFDDVNLSDEKTVLSLIRKIKSNSRYGKTNIVIIGNIEKKYELYEELECIIDNLHLLKDDYHISVCEFSRVI